MVIVDAAGLITLVNAEAERLFGYPRAEMVGSRVELLVPERFRAGHPGHRHGYAAAPRSRPLGAGGVALWGCRKDGSEFPAEISLSPLESPEGTLAITAIRDLTDRIKAEEQRFSLETARQAIRLRDEFLSTAAHELRTPIAALVMMAEVVRRLVERDAAQVPPVLLAKLGAIGRAARSLNTLVNQLLDLSQITAGRLSLNTVEMDLGETVRRSVAAFDDELERAGCDLAVRETEPLRGCWDPLRVEQIVTNLVSNALKYGEGRPIELTLSRTREGKAALSLRDHGVGIAQDEQGLIFERFERATSSHGHGGFGLGLWIVRQLVEAHGGTVSVSSEPGAGSLFTVELPLPPPGPPGRR